MATAPYGVRLLVGAAAIAVEETIRLPRTILMYPMTLVSQAAHLVMLFQQNVAELVIKGDETLEILFRPKEEQPAWATFDEDMIEVNGIANGQSASVDAGDEDRRAEGRFALYSVPAAAETGAVGALLPADPAPASPAPASPADADVTMPAVAVELDYQTLTLAQLRARLQPLDADELQALLSYEQATKARPPFETLIANRITRATAK